MKLVGKKLYRIGPLKLFKNGWGSVGNRGRGAEASRGMRSSGGGGSISRPSNGDRARRAKEAREAAAAAAAAKERERIKEEKRARAEMKGVFEKKLTGAGPQEEARKIQQEAINRMRSGETGRTSREQALAGLVGSQHMGGAAGKKMLQQQASGISRKAGAEALGTAKDVVGMGGKMRVQDIGLAKADKTGAMKAQQLIMGEKLAREGMKTQIEAAKAGASRCFGGETKISTPSGQVYIKDIKAGDEVLSFDDEGQISVNIVSKVHEHEPGDIYKLSYWGGEVLVTTNHWILEANNTFLQVDKFNTDHCLVDEEGNFRPFKSLEFYELDKTYNITVEDDHTYIANGIRVHNGGGGKAEGGEVLKKYAKGGSYPKKNGKIQGAGTETSDSIKARLSDGEFVVNARTVRGLGEALGAKGKEDTRQKGSAYLYALQSKYGTKRFKKSGDQLKGILPVKMSAGGSIDWGDVAKYGSMVAKTGILGKGAQRAGTVVGAGVEAKEGAEKAEKAKAKKAADKAFRKKQEAYYDKELAKGKPEAKPSITKPSPEAVGIRETKSLMAKPAGVAKPDSSAKMSYSSPFAKEDAAKYQKFADRSKEAVAAKQNMLKMKENPDMAKRLKDGGKVSKDHPHYKFLKELDKWTAHHFPKGKKVDLDPGRKADKAIRAKKGSIEPVEMEKGGDWRKAIADKLKKKYGHVMNKKALRKRISQAIKGESGKRKKKYESNMKMEKARKRGPDNELAQIAEEKEFRKKQALKAAAAKRVREDKKALVGDANYAETITKEKRDEKLFQDQLKSAKGLGMKVKKPISKRAGVGVDYNPFKKLGKKVSKFFNPDLKDIDPSRLTEKEKKILEDRKYKKTKLTGLGELVDKEKRGKQEKLVKKFRKELKEEQPAVERESERRKKVLKKEEEKADFFKRYRKQKTGQSDDRLAKGIAKEALEASKLRRGLGKGSKIKAGKRVDLLAGPKARKLINQHGSGFAKKIKKHMKDQEELVRSEKIGKEVYSPARLKQMELDYRRRQDKDAKIGDAAGLEGNKTAIKAMQDHWDKMYLSKDLEKQDKIRRETARKRAAEKKEGIEKISGGLGPAVYEKKKAKIEAPKPKVAPKTKTPEVK